MFEIPLPLLREALGRFSAGGLSGGEVGRRFIGICVEQCKNYLMDSFSSVLPYALTIAGAILVVNVGWRLFRNFTKG